MKASADVTKRRNPRLLLMCLVLLAALAAGSGPAHGGPPSAPSGAPSSQPGVPADLIPEVPDPDGFVTVEVGDYFSCDVPPDWSRFDKYGSGFGLSNEEKKTHGFHLKAPVTGGLPITIAIFYYAEGNLMYTSMDHYLRVFSQSAPEGDGDGNDYGKITPITVSGREGMVFESISVRSVASGTTGSDKPGVYIRPGLNAKRVPVRERFVVLPAPSGFYALRYTAPTEKFQEFLPVFEQVTKRFYAKR